MKKLFLILLSLLALTFSACNSDEPNTELTINDLPYTMWNGRQTQYLPGGNIQTIDFIILFSAEKEGIVTYFDSNGTPLQNLPIYYGLEGGIFSFKGAFDGNYRIVKRSHNAIELEAYIPNHSLMTLFRKE